MHTNHRRSDAKRKDHRPNYRMMGRAGWIEETRRGRRAAEGRAIAAFRTGHADDVIVAGDNTFSNPYNWD